jgi:hypothetical protein
LITGASGAVLVCCEDMRRLASFVVVSVLTGCSSPDAPRGVPQDFDTGIPVFDANKPDSGMPADTGTPSDTSVVVTDTGTPPGDAYFPDVTSKDTNPGDVTKLEEGGPPDVPPDTTLPDALSFIDSAVEDSRRD